MTQDVFDRLADDHHQHGHTSFKLAVAFGRPQVDADEVREHLSLLIGGMLDHMASEEEHLFPWFRKYVPERTLDVDGLISQHVQIALHVAEFEIGLRHKDRHSFKERLETAKAFVKLMDNHAALERELALLSIGRAIPGYVPHR